MDVTADADGPTRRPSPASTRWVRTVIALAVAVAVFGFALPRFASAAEVCGTPSGTSDGGG